jgi:transcriptional regulator GlxA family with amidase domain
MIEVALVVSPGFQMMILAAMTAFEVANIASGESIYNIRVLSEHGGPVRSSLGWPLETEAFSEPLFDTLVIGGLIDVNPPVSDGLLNFIRGSLPGCRRVASICTGAFMLAEAGLLDGRRATTHWLYARELRNRYPKIRVEDDRIFIIDGPVWTSAGMTAGLDLVLGMIEKDYGAKLARLTAKSLVLYHRRAGGQSQYSALLEMEPKSDRIQLALAYARSNLRSTLTVERLAEAARLSPRQFSRAFRTETGQSPAKAIEQLRLEAARVMMEDSSHPVEVVAVESGFVDTERMRRAFVRAFGHPPQAIRRNARDDSNGEGSPEH